MKRLILILLVCSAALKVSAQWTEKDSLNLKRILKGEEDIKLNLDAVKLIDFGSGMGTPKMSEEKNWALPDETLPLALPKKKIVLTLRPYTANTRFDWDPIYQRKIVIDKNTWRGDPFYELRHQISYSNWAHNPMEGGVRKSLDEIRSSGVRFHQMGERANGMLVNSVSMGGGIPLYSGVSINGGTIGGLDLMTVFTKDFWDKKGRERRERTLEVLRSYGDSTTHMINRSLEPITR